MRGSQPALRRAPPVRNEGNRFDLDRPLLPTLLTRIGTIVIANTPGIIFGGASLYTSFKGRREAANAGRPAASTSSRRTAAPLLGNSRRGATDGQDSRQSRPRFQGRRSNGGLVRHLLARVREATAARTVLQTLVDVPDVGHTSDLVLGAVARRHAGLVLDFLGARVRRWPVRSAWRYDPIPFPIDALQEPLAADPALLIAAVRGWYDMDPLSHEYQGARLLRNMTPLLAPEFAIPLGEIVRSGDRDGIGFVLATLLGFEGGDQVHPLCMEIVDRLEVGDPMLGRVSHVLGQTGVLTGGFGFVEAEQERRRLLDP